MYIVFCISNKLWKQNELLSSKMANKRQSRHDQYNRSADDKSDMYKGQTRYRGNGNNHGNRYRNNNNNNNDW